MAIVEYAPPEKWARVETESTYLPRFCINELRRLHETGPAEPLQDHFAEFSETVYALVRAKRDESAIGTALDYFDNLLLERKYVDCNLALRQLQVSRLSSAVLVSILGITIRAKAMKARAEFYKCAFDSISKEKGTRYAKELLTKYR